MSIRKEFAAQRLNEQGIERVQRARRAFENLGASLDLLPLSAGQERSVVFTKLEEALFFVNKALSLDTENQRQD